MPDFPGGPPADDLTDWHLPCTVCSGVDPARSSPEGRALETTLAIGCLPPPAVRHLARALGLVGPGAPAPGVPPDGWLLGATAAGLGLAPAALRSSVEAFRGAARAVLARGRQAGLTALPVWDRRYPAALRTIGDPPLVLWARGALGPLAGPGVAIIGARRATGPGVILAGRLAGELATSGVLVVSGLARGIDGAAHEGALARGGPTIAVLGSGADVIYPPEHADLARRIVQAGVLLSEFEPGTPPRPVHFPRRNRIVSGLATAVVVIEARALSGSYVAARGALHQGRPVLVLAGSRDPGTAALIKEGARWVETVGGALEVLGRLSGRNLRRPGCISVDRSPVRAPADPFAVGLVAAQHGRPGPGGAESVRGR